MTTGNCHLQREILFKDLFTEDESNPERSVYCSLGCSSNRRLLVLKKLHAYDARFDSVKIFNHNFQCISSFFCGNGGETGIVFWPDDGHVLTPGFAQTHLQAESDKHDGLKLYSIYEPQTYTNPLLDVPLDCLRNINCHLKASSRSGRYLSVVKSHQMIIDTETNQWWKIDSQYAHTAFSFDEKYIISYMGLRIGGNYSIIDITERRTVCQGDGFLGINPIGFTYYSRGFDAKHSKANIVEVMFAGEVLREFDFEPYYSCTSVSHDNQWMAFGSSGSVTILSLNDISNTWRYQEENKKSPFYDTSPTEILFFNDSHIVIVHYWDVGMRIFTFD